MDFYTTLLEQYHLMESFKDILKQHPKISDDLEKYYHTAMPDNNKADRITHHIIKLHKSGNLTHDNAPEFKKHLTALAATNQLNKLDGLNTLDDHQNATKDILDKAVTKKQRVDKNTPVLLNTDDLLVRQHLNHESAEKAARMHPENPMYNVPKEPGKAAWCVSIGGENGEAHFNHYTETGTLPMYTIYHKKTKRIHALVANPSDTRDTVELRDENDDQPYTVNADLHTFLNEHPGIEHTPAGVHLRRLTDEHMEEEDNKVLAAMHDKDKLHAALLDDEIAAPKRISLLRSPHITEEHIRDVITNPNTPIRLKINAIRSKLSDKSTMKDIQAHSKPLMDILNDTNANIKLKDSIAMSPRLSQEHADHIMNENDNISKSILITHNSEFITPDHVNGIMDSKDYNLKRRILNDLDQHVTPQHVHNIIMEPHSQDPDERNNQKQLTKNVLENYPHYIKDEHIKHIMNVGSELEKEAAIHSDAFNAKHMPTYNI